MPLDNQARLDRAFRLSVIAAIVLSGTMKKSDRLTDVEVLIAVATALLTAAEASTGALPFDSSARE